LDIFINHKKLPIHFLDKNGPVLKTGHQKIIKKSNQQTEKMAEHDQSYKKLFSHQKMVADLLRFIDEPWVKRLDLESLETVKSSFVSDTLRERHDDIIWRAKLDNKWFYIYLLIEFQSSIDQFMAVRLMIYIGLFYQHLIETQKLTAKDKLPPVLPIVIYNGIPRWDAAENISELVENLPGGFRKYCPHLRYYLIDEGSYPLAQLASQSNLVSALIRLEQTRMLDNEQEVAKAISKVLIELLDWLKEPKSARLRRDWVVWLKRVLLPRNVPNVEIPEVIELQELNAMLYENMQAWYKEAENKGEKRGERRGEARGEIKGQAKMLIKLLEDEFGKVDHQAQMLIYELDEENLRDCYKRLKIALSVDDVIGHLY
jgi:predicted transposase YdaD